MRRRKLIKNILSEGLMLGYKKFPDRYFDSLTLVEFPKSKINEHPRWYKNEYDNNGNVIYRQNFNGYWQKWEYDNNGDVIYRETSNGYWAKFEYDENRNVVYYENSDNEWVRWKYSYNRKLIYREDNNYGITIDNRDRIQEGLTLQYKKFPDRYFDGNTLKEFPKSKINKHPSWRKLEYDTDGNIIYHETSDGNWVKYEYDTDGNEIYHETSDGNWVKYEYDTDGNEIYMENGNGYWVKREYDAAGYEIYYENSDGTIRDYIQEGLMLPYRKKIEYSDLLPQIKKFNNTVGDVLFEYSDHMGGNFDIRFQINATAGFYEFNYYWSYDNANYITLFIWHVDFATEYEKEIYNDTIKINDVNDLNEELIDYTQNVIDNILPQVTEYYG